MSETILTAIITAAVTLIGVILQSRAQHNATMAEMQRQSELSDQRLDAKLERHMAVTEAKLEALTEEVRKHNGHSERITALEEKASSANRRLTDLEHRAS